ncbi:hypothetical protein [Brevibacillus daliensis]|uniref:hypothetical protein n=1 Tax=Brevibacillus daliensis TaxID=2892995 RepID=UPI001E4C83EE|nr:hypothetical protein [Brevibacillus daliensis]
MEKSISCHKCYEEITYKEDLVTAVKFFTVVPYHTDCFAIDSYRSFRGLGPLNGFRGIIVIAIACLFIVTSLVEVVNGDLSFLSIVIFWLLLVYAIIYSYWKYERHLKELPDQYY